MTCVCAKDSDFLKNNLAFVGWWEHTTDSLVAFQGICVNSFHVAEELIITNPDFYHMIIAARE